jgi:hypothetical protein
MSLFFARAYNFNRSGLTLRILSEMSQAQALAKPDFISERIQLNEARLMEATVKAMGFANAASYH